MKTPILAFILFHVFEFGGVSDPSDLEGVSVAVVASQDANFVTFEIINQSIDPDPVVTKVAFGSDNGTEFVGHIWLLNDLDVEFVRDDNINIPGANNIGFETWAGFSAAPPPTRNGINGGESMTVSMDAQNLDSLLIAVHVQAINGGSASYVADPWPGIKPEPSTPLMLALGGAMCLMRRARKWL